MPASPSARSPDPGIVSPDSRAVSPVVGAALLVVVVVLLATVLGSVAFSLQDALVEPSPTVAFDVDYHADGAGNGGNGAYVNVTHEVGTVADGSTVYVRDGAGNEVAWEAVWTGESTVSPGGYLHVDGAGSDGALNPICETGQRYVVVAKHEDGTSTMLREIPIPSDPTARAPDC